MLLDPVTILIKIQLFINWGEYQIRSYDGSKPLESESALTVSDLLPESDFPAYFSPQETISTQLFSELCLIENMRFDYPKKKCPFMSNIRSLK